MPADAVLQLGARSSKPECPAAGCSCHGGLVMIAPAAPVAAWWAACRLKGVDLPLPPASSQLARSADPLLLRAGMHAAAGSVTCASGAVGCCTPTWPGAAPLDCSGQWEGRTHDVFI